MGRGQDLIEAARAGDADTLSALLAQGADPNAVGGSEYFVAPALVHAVASSALDCVVLLVRAGADVNAQVNGRCVAAFANDVTVLRALFDAGADPHWRSEHAILVQQFAASGLGIETSTALLTELRSRGVDLNQRRLFPPLWSAAQSGDAEAVEALLRAGADPNSEPNPLGGAVWGTGSLRSDQRTQQVIDLLVAAGANLAVLDQNGLGLMHGALQPYSHGVGFQSSDGINVEAARALLRHGLSIDIVYPDGRRPLHLAAEEPDPEAITLLLANGARVDERDANGRSALDLALARAAEFATWAHQRRDAAPESDDATFRELLQESTIPDIARCIGLLRAAEAIVAEKPASTGDADLREP
jgi:ankyrin repeat protein